MKRPIGQIFKRGVLVGLGVSLFLWSSLFAQADTTSTDVLARPQLAETLEESMLIKGTISQQVNEHDEAIEMFLLGLEKNQNSAPLLLGLSESYLSLEDFNSALFYVDQAIALDSRNPILIAQKMSIFSVQKDTEKLKELLDYASAENVSSQDIGDFRYLLNQQANSNDAADRSATNESRRIDLILDRIEKSRSSPSTDSETIAIEESIDQSELTNASKDFLRGRLSYANQAFEDAFKSFEQSISEDPKNVSSWAFLIKAASSAGDHAKASLFAEQAELIFPFQKEVELANIHRLIASNDLEEATKQIQAISVGAEWESDKSSLMKALSEKLEAEKKPQ